MDFSWAKGGKGAEKGGYGKASVPSVVPATSPYSKPEPKTDDWSYPTTDWDSQLHSFKLVKFSLSSFFWSCGAGLEVNYDEGCVSDGLQCVIMQYDVRCLHGNSVGAAVWHPWHTFFWRRS